MDSYSLDHLSNEALFKGLNAALSRARVNLAELLAHLAEFDARRLYASAGYGSMFSYCVEVLHFSEPEAARRIQAARAVRKFPALLPALSSGRLHLTAVSLLAPHLSRDNADDLIEAATHRSRYAIETLLARRFPDALPKVGVAVWIRHVAQRPVPQPEDAPQPLFDSSPGQPSHEASMSVDNSATSLVPMRLKEHRLGDVPTSNPTHAIPTAAILTDPAPADMVSAETVPGDMAPSDPIQAPAHPDATELFLVRVAIPRSTHDKLREAQALLSHTVRPQDLAELLDRALDALVALLKRRRLGVSPIPRRRVELPEKGGRYIPSHIRHAVWKRDGGQCTFVSDDGHRCQERRHLEFDHVEPVARGGTATVDTVRLRCRTHNQLEAERVFGAGFMAEKRRPRSD